MTTDIIFNLLGLYDSAIAYDRPDGRNGDVAHDLALLTHRGGPPFPSVAVLEALIPQMESEKAVEITRELYRATYTQDEFNEAVFEKFSEGRSAKFDAIQEKRLAIKNR